MEDFDMLRIVYSIIIMQILILLSKYIKETIDFKAMVENKISKKLDLEI